MAGRIRDADVALVRDRSPIVDVVGAQVQLRNAGGGRLKGLCPFHDEKTPSFSVRPEAGFYYCFGCGEGGDVISFVRKIGNLSFAEAVEQLAGRAGVTLTYEGGGSAARSTGGVRQRLIEAHKAAAEFYAEQLVTADARIGRDFLATRGFDRAAAERFTVGFAPAGWEALTKHLLSRKFTREELVAGGLAKESSRGSLIDRFHRRLLWPIRDLTGEVVGFGARRLFDDDPVAAKYLNTPETPIFKKGSLLYGADLARREIGRRYQVVVVEGYTDVMACHLAGVPTAVASCGTAFGAEHVRVLRRLLMDQDEQRGEVVFTFDGDAAGQAAAMKAFEFEERFVTQTFVAVEPSGLDPCDLRLQHGDQAVVDLVARRVPLVEFAVRGVLGRYDLESTEGRLAALDAAAPLVNRLKDRGLRQRYAVNLDRWLGFLDEEFVRRRVAEHAAADAARAARSGPGQPGQPAQPGQPGTGQARPNGRPGADGTMPQQRPGPFVGGTADDRPDDAVVSLERQALQLALQRPALAGPVFDTLGPEFFTVPMHRAVREAVSAAGGVCSAGELPTWVAAVTDAATDDDVRRTATALAVAPLPYLGVDLDRYVGDVLRRLQELDVTRRVTGLKSRLQRLNPVTDPDGFNRAFGELAALEQYRQQLRERGLGAT